MAGHQLTEEQKARGRHWLPILRRKLHPSEFPAIDQRHQVDQALATTRAVRP